MATSSSKSSSSSTLDPSDLASFTKHLQSSRRIVALLGAGLSASSGLPTFRGAGGLWRTYDATSLATPEAFQADPGLVWQFYSYRRHMALNASPNPAHYALAELAKRNPSFMTISQNVDGLSPRADHPANQLKLIHGNLFDVKCWDEHGCGYVTRNDFTDPIVPALAIPEDQGAAEESVNEPGDGAGRVKVSSLLGHKIAKKHALIRGQDISDIAIPIPTIPQAELPQCPQCKSNLLRPGVVWFGEGLPDEVMHDITQYMYAPERIDLMLVIGTSSVVYPAAGYTEIARSMGARVAVINMDRNDAKGMRKEDWFFGGDAAVIVPEILKSVIGELPARDVEAGKKDEDDKKTSLQ